MSTARIALARPRIARRAGAALLLAGGFAAVAPAADRCNSLGCRPGAHGGANACEEEGCFESFTRRFREWKRVTHAGLRMKHEGHLREDALEHPECPPYHAPAWGYHETCWRQFPNHEIPPCPPYHPPSGHHVAPAGGGSAPPPPAPYPTHLAAPSPVPAPLPNAVETPDELTPLVPADPPAASEPVSPEPEPSEPSVPRAADPFADPIENEANVVPPVLIIPASAEVPVLEIAEPAASTPPFGEFVAPRPIPGRAMMSDEAADPTRPRFIPPPPRPHVPKDPRYFF